MKKALIIGLLLWGLAPLRAQTDSVSATVPYDTAYSEDEYQAPNINPIYYFGSPFSDHFAEAKIFLGTMDVGAGLSYAYLPEVWGFNLSAYAHNTLWVLAGAEYRLSKPWNKHDWHLFGSAGINYDEDFATTRPAMEVGVRATFWDTGTKFCTNSASLGVMTDFDGVYVTVGASLSLSLIFLTLLLL
jgi:hypothetical protein